MDDRTVLTLVREFLHVAIWEFFTEVTVVDWCSGTGYRWATAGGEIGKARIHDWTCFEN